MALHPLFRDRIRFRNVDFCGGRKSENPEKNPRSRDENYQQQTQPTYDAGSGNQTQATSVGGERSHHCAIPAPPKANLVVDSSHVCWELSLVTVE